MDHCPNEVLLYVFELACDDDGSTGRILSLVSRRFHHLAEECMYQTIAVVGLGRMNQLAAILERLPEGKRRVRHVFLSTVAQRTHNGLERLPDEITPNHQEMCDLFTRLFKLISRTLVSCRIVSHAARTATLLPISCPRLRSLSLEGPFPTLSYENNACFPSLRTLRFSSFTEYPCCLLDNIARQAPHITNLSFFPSQACRNLCIDLGSAFAIPTLPRAYPDYILPAKEPAPNLLPELKEVIVQPGRDVEPEGRNAHCLRSAQELMKKQLLYMQRHDKLRRMKYIAPRPALIASESLSSWLQEP